MKPFKFIILVCALMFVLAAPLQTFAQSERDFGKMPVFVPENSTVERVVVWGNDVRIAGTVKEIVVVIYGDVYLEPTAKVDLVMDLGGHVHDSSGKSSYKDIFEVSFNQELLNQLLLAGSLILGLWSLRLTLSFLGILALSALGLALRNRLRYARELLQEQGVRMLGLGLTLALISLTVSVLLTFTVIGIPLALLIGVIALVSAVIGLLPVMGYLSDKLLASSLSSHPPLTYFFAQAVLLVALANLPLVGFVFILCVGWTGVAVTWVSFWKKRHIFRPKS